MQNKVKLYQAERLDLPDVQNMLDFTEEELQAWTSSIFAGTPLSGVPTSYVLKGFTPANISNLSLEVVVADSALFNAAVSTGSLSGATYRGEATAANLPLTVSDDEDNYVHVVVSRVSGEADMRVFWDRVANAGEGAEWSQVVNTVDSLSVSLYVSTIGWSADVDKIPIFKVTAAAGVITSIEDYRNLFFRLGKPGDTTFTNYLTSRLEPSPDILSDTLAFTGGDKEITSLKVWMDTVMSAIKEIKWGSGPNKWYQRAPTHLDSDQDILTDGGTWSWEVIPILDGSGAGVFAHATYTSVGGAHVAGPLASENFVTNGTAVGTWTVANPTSLVVGDPITIYSSAAHADPLVGTVRSITPGATDVIEMDVGRLYFDADATILLDGGVYYNTIETAVDSPIIMTEDDLAYANLNRGATVSISPVVVANSAYVTDPDRMILVRRIGDVVYIGGTPLTLIDTGTGTLSVAIDANLYTYISTSGTPLDPTPDYDALVADPVVYITNNVDALDTAAAKLDNACQVLAKSMPPVGSIIPWYNFGVGAGALAGALDTDYWAYCDGNAIPAVGGVLDGQLTPDLSNRYLVGFGTEAGGDIGTAAWLAALGNELGAANHRINLAHVHTGPSHVHTGPSHVHTIAEHVHVFSISSHTGYEGAHYHVGLFHNGNPGDIEDSGGNGNTGPAIPANHRHSIILTGTTNLGGPTGTAAAGTGNTGASGTANTGTNLSATQSIQCRSIRVRWIIRVL